MRKLAITIAAALAMFGAGFGAASAASKDPQSLCPGKPGSIPYAYCSLKIEFPRNAIVCGTNIPTASNCAVFMDGAVLGHDYGRGRDLVYGP